MPLPAGMIFAPLFWRNTLISIGDDLGSRVRCHRIDKQILQRATESWVMKLVTRSQCGLRHYSLTIEEHLGHFAHQHSQRHLGDRQEGGTVQNSGKLASEFAVGCGFRRHAVYRAGQFGGKHGVAIDAYDVFNMYPWKPL